MSIGGRRKTPAGTQVHTSIYCSITSKTERGRRFKLNTPRIPEAKTDIASPDGPPFNGNFRVCIGSFNAYPHALSLDDGPCFIATPPLRTQILVCRIDRSNPPSIRDSRRRRAHAVAATTRIFSLTVAAVFHKPGTVFTFCGTRQLLSGVTINEKCVVEFKAIFREGWHRAASACQGK
jgi:hypothetical protein